MHLSAPCCRAEGSSILLLQKNGTHFSALSFVNNLVMKGNGVNVCLESERCQCFHKITILLTPASGSRGAATLPRPVIGLWAGSWEDGDK